MRLLGMACINLSLSEDSTWTIDLRAPSHDGEWWLHASRVFQRRDEMSSGCLQAGCPKSWLPPARRLDKHDIKNQRPLSTRFSHP